MPPSVTEIDHLVLTVRDIDATLAFYTQVLGMRAESFHPADGTTRAALKFGIQKINLHQSGAEFDPKAATPGAGTADLCFLTDNTIEAWQTALANHDVRVEDGPVRRTGATGPILSLYIRDPDGNLIEIAVPDG